MAKAAPMEMRSLGGPQAPSIPATETTGLVGENAPPSGEGLESPKAVITSENFYPYSTTVMPARAVGRLFMRAWSPTLGSFYNSSCSATVVAAENKATVWLAGHCVYNTYSNVWSRNYVFCPGYRDANGTAWEGVDCPLGKWAVKYQQTTPQWKNAVCSASGPCTEAEFVGDFAAFTMYPLSGVLIQNRTNSHIIRYNTQVADTYAFGYPADPSSFYPFNGRFLYWCIASSTFSGDLRIPCHMTGGASGGPWLGPWNTAGRSYLNSVNSHGGSTVMHGPFQGLYAQRLYDLMRNQNPL